MQITTCFTHELKAWPSDSELALSLRQDSRAAPAQRMPAVEAAGGCIYKSMNCVKRQA